MTPRARGVFVRLVLVVTLLPATFVLLQGQARETETRVAAWALRRLGAGIGAVVGSSVYVVPDNDAPFYAVVTPSCSALASVLAIACLASVVPATSRRRKFAAAGAAIVTVAVGNILRIMASLGTGVVAGRSSLVLFHDSVGNVFSFAYTLGGYILMLYLLLPARAPSEPDATSQAPAVMAHVAG